MGEGTPSLQIDFVAPEGRALRLPAVGEAVIVLSGGFCNNIGSSYARVMTLDRVLLWEGGDPGCGTDDPGRFPWTPEPILGVRAHPGASTCVDKDEWDTQLPPRQGCCCMTRTEMEVFLRTQGEPAVLPGADVPTEIDGRAYIASSVGEARVAGGPCIWDIDGTTGGGYVALLAE